MSRGPYNAGDQSNVPDDDVVEVSRRELDIVVDELHHLCPIEDPHSPLWDLWLKVSALGGRS